MAATGVAIPTLPGHDAPVASRFYVEGRGRAAAVVALFERIAHRYDLINDLQSFGLHRLWKRKLLRAAAVHPGERALDLCCGTGDVAWSLASLGAVVTGADFSPSMLALARNRRAASGGAPPTFVEADALALPFADASFDVATISYGLRNLADLDRGLAEMVRVVRPGGRILALEFGLPTNALWRRIWVGYLGFVIPWFGRIFVGDADAYGYLQTSLLKYPAQRGVEERLHKLGCKDICTTDLLGGIMAVQSAVVGE